MPQVCQPELRRGRWREFCPARSRGPGRSLEQELDEGIKISMVGIFRFHCLSAFLSVFCLSCFVVCHWIRLGKTILQPPGRCVLQNSNVLTGVQAGGFSTLT